MKKLDLNTVRKFGNLELLARQLVEGFITGLHQSPFHGFSVEFAEHRLYNTGESTKHIDWKILAKTDKLFVKQYEEETNLRCQIVLDISSSMFYPKENYGKLTFGIMTAASIAYLLRKQRDAVSLCTFAEHIELHTPFKSTSVHIHQIMLQLEHLLNADPGQKQTHTADIIHQIAEKINRRSLVIILSDMMDKEDNENIFKALQHLKHNKHEVLIFHLIDRKTEQNFQFANRPYEFIDLETGDRMKVNPHQVQKIYQEKFLSRHHDLRLKCGQNKIDFIEVDIDNDYEKVLYTYLMKRSKMK